MSLDDFFVVEDQRRLNDAVAKIAQEYGSTIVIAVAPSSSAFQHAHLKGGLVTAFAALCLFLYHPEPFDHTFFPLEQAGAFALGALVTRAIPVMRRLFMSDQEIDAAVNVAARGTFVERGVASRSPARDAVLVYVSIFERRVVVVPDIGVDVSKLGVAWSDATKKIERAVSREHDVKAFCDALGGLASLLRREPGAAS